MAKYVNIEALRTEIYRLAKVNKELTPRDFTEGIAAGYADVLSFLDSVEDESYPKVKGWVARDKNGSLFFFTTGSHIAHWSVYGRVTL